MKLLLATLSVICFAFQSVVVWCSTISTTYAGDDRVGYATHFEQGWNPDSVMPMIADSGVGWIRDDWSWNGCEHLKGVYQVPADQQHWLDVAQANGLKVVLILNPNPIYRDEYDPVAASNFCAWLAKTEGNKIGAIEVCNEPNNLYAKLEGGGWPIKYVTLLNSIYAAVQVSNPSTLVIGTGSQGANELYMLGLGIQADGVTYHPYLAGDTNAPETVYEPPYTEYVAWVQAVQAATKLPIWETEWGIGTYNGISEYNQAMLDARRLLESLGLGVAHTFIYDAKDENNITTSSYYMSGAMRASLSPKQGYFAMQRLLAALTNANATGTGVQVNPKGSAANFDFADFRGYVFQDAVKRRVVVAVWIGNAPTNILNDVSYTAQITFTVPYFHSTSIVLDPLTGDTLPVSSYKYSQAGKKFTIYDFPITSSPKIIIMK